MATLVKGQSGSVVKKLQESLRKVGAKIKVSGTFDDATETAVMKFQKAAGLKPTGKVDSGTQRALAEHTKPVNWTLDDYAAKEKHGRAHADAAMKMVDFYRTRVGETATSLRKAADELSANLKQIESGIEGALDEYANFVALAAEIAELRRSFETKRKSGDLAMQREIVEKAGRLDKRAKSAEARTESAAAKFRPFMAAADKTMDALDKVNLKAA